MSKINSGTNIHFYMYMRVMILLFSGDFFNIL